MKRCIPAILFFFVLNTFAQKLDSIPHEFGKLYFHTYGQGEPLLILSGGPGNDAKTLTSMAEQLAKNHYVILLEQRGTGLSVLDSIHPGTVSIQAAMDDINAVIKHQNFEKIKLLGHSYGASLASVYTSRYPEKVAQLVLISSGLFSFDEAYIAMCNIQSRMSKDEANYWEELIVKSFNTTLTSKEKDSLNYLNRSAYFLDKNKTKDFMKLIDIPMNAQTKEVLDNDLLAMNIDLKQTLGPIHVPIDMIMGRQDILDFMAFEYKLAKPEMKLHWMDACGHFPMFEDPETFYNLLNDILH